MDKYDHMEKIKSPQNMKVLYLTLNPDLQGPLPKNDPLLIDALEELGCQVTRCTWGRHSEKEKLLTKITGRLGDVSRILINLLKIRPHILYVNTALDEYGLARDIPLLLATCWSPAKKVLKMHGSKLSLLEGPGHLIYKLLTRVLIFFSDAILLLSVEEQEKWTHFERRGKYYRIENPFSFMKTMEAVQKAEDRQNTNDLPMLLFVGRLIKEKGIYEVLDAFELVSKQIPCRLYIAGEGVEKGEIVKQIEKKNLINSVSLLGYLDEERLSRAYQNASIFILPSYREGFPIAVTEAMSFGLPIVTTPVGGIPDRLLDGQNALFVTPKNAEAVAGAVLRLLKDRDLCFQMSRANLSKVRELTTDKVTPRYLDIFQKLLLD